MGGTRASNRTYRFHEFGGIASTAAACVSLPKLVRVHAWHHFHGTSAQGADDDLYAAT